MTEVLPMYAMLLSAQYWTMRTLPPSHPPSHAITAVLKVGLCCSQCGCCSTNPP